MSDAVPDGFELARFKSLYEERIGPIYALKQDKEICLGLRVAKKHCNSLGIVHGGLMATLADVSLAWALVIARGDGMGAITLNLNLDYVSSAQIDDWIEVHIEINKSHGSIGFANCEIKTADKLLLFGNGAFKFIPRD